jgi:hypothetical protein
VMLGSQPQVQWCAACARAPPRPLLPQRHTELLHVASCTHRKYDDRAVDHHQHCPPQEHRPAERQVVDASDAAVALGQEQDEADACASKRDISW